MRNLRSLVSGILLGCLALVGMMFVAPQVLRAGDGFCDRMEDGSIVCCSTDESGQILDCTIIPT